MFATRDRECDRERMRVRVCERDRERGCGCNRERDCERERDLYLPDYMCLPTIIARNMTPSIPTIVYLTYHHRPEHDILLLFLELPLGRRLIHLYKKGTSKAQERHKKGTRTDSVARGK